MDQARPKLDPTEPGQEDNPEMIRRNIQHTRADICETVNTLQKRLSPDRVKAEVKSAAREQLETAKENVRFKAEQWQRKATERIINNPIPAVMVGVGLMWLFTKAADSTSERDHGGRYRGSYSYDSPEDWPVYAPEDKSGRIPHPQQRSQEQKRMGSTNAPPSGQPIGEQVSQWADRAQDSLEDWKTSASSYADQIGSSAKERGQRVQGEFQRYLQDNPLTVGTVTLAIGAAIGLSLPRTEKEDQWLGETRDKFMDQAKTTAKEILPKTKEIADEMTQAAREAVKEQMGGHVM